MICNWREEVAQERIDIDAQVFDRQGRRNGRRIASGTAYPPIPVQHQIAAQLGHPAYRAHAELKPQTQIGLHIQFSFQRGRWVAQQVDQQQAVCSIADQVYRQTDHNTARLEADKV